MEIMLKAFLILLIIAVVLGANGRGYQQRRRNNQNRARQPSQVQGCRINNSGQNGVCRRLSKCPNAQFAYYTKKTTPTYCQNDRSSDPIVCCASAPTNTQITPPKRNDQLRGKRISEKKCDEIYFPDDSGTFHITVVGGVRTERGEFLYMAALGWSKTTGAGYEYLCGGSLIARNFVLTAAHCGSIGGAAPDVVRTGGDSLDDTSGLIPDIPISRIIVHPGYRRKQTYNDIALLQLSYNSGHNPACLWPTRGVNYPEVTAVGYGQTQFAGKASKHLLKVVLKIFSNEECKRYYSAGYRLENGIVDSQICVGDPYKVKDTCQGDSGGPIVIKANVKGTEVPYVLGITSFGQGCAGGPPSIYTRVPSYLDWIESIVWPSG